MTIANAEHPLGNQTSPTLVPATPPQHNVITTPLSLEERKQVQQLEAQLERLRRNQNLNFQRELLICRQIQQIEPNPDTVRVRRTAHWTNFVGRSHRT